MEEVQDLGSPDSLLKEYFLRRDATFRQLSELREKGWKSSLGDKFFKNQRERADNVDAAGQETLYKMMQMIGDEMHSQTQALSLPSSAQGPIRVLDLCMAPGGYSARMLKEHPDAVIRGISLPEAQGGHRLLLTGNPNKPDQIKCSFHDITMFAAEFGVNSIPAEHPEQTRFLTRLRPYLHEPRFHLVFCDGQKLRTHHPPQHREPFEAVRLSAAQYILAMQRIATGGTLIVLLHTVDSWRSVKLLHQFSRFADLRLFKPRKAHAIRNSFYLVAENVQPKRKAAKAAVREWKDDWWRATFGGEDRTGEMGPQVDLATVQNALDVFGEKLIELARPIWRIQAEALGRASFTQT